jgi:hypothetical protein
MRKWDYHKVVLSPILSNLYLEEAIKSSNKLEEVRSRGVLGSRLMESKVEQEEVRDTQWRKKEDEEISGIKCSATVKYLLLREAVYIKEQIKI